MDHIFELKTRKEAYEYMLSLLYKERLNKFNGARIIHDQKIRICKNAIALLHGEIEKNVLHPDPLHVLRDYFNVQRLEEISLRDPDTGKSWGMSNIFKIYTCAWWLHKDKHHKRSLAAIGMLLPRKTDQGIIKPRDHATILYLTRKYSEQKDYEPELKKYDEDLTRIFKLKQLSYV